jgi:hypothetical protein
MKSKMLSMIVAAGLLLLTIPPAQAQQQKAAPNVQLPPGGCPPHCAGAGSPTIPPTLSQAVVTTMQTSMVNLSNKITAGRAGATDYASAATGFQAFSSNAQEVGFTSNIQAWILANPSLFTNANPTQAQFQTGYTALKNMGVIATLAEYENSITSVAASDRQAFLTTVQTSGLNAYHTQVVNALNAAAAQASKRLNGGAVAHASCERPMAAIGLYLGIVALACGGPVGWGIAAAGLACGGGAFLCI